MLELVSEGSVINGAYPVYFKTKGHISIITLSSMDIANKHIDSRLMLLLSTRRSPILKRLLTVFSPNNLGWFNALWSQEAGLPLSRDGQAAGRVHLVYSLYKF